MILETDLHWGLVAVVIFLIYLGIILYDASIQQYTININHDEFSQLSKKEQAKFQKKICSWCGLWINYHYYYNPCKNTIDHICGGQFCLMTDDTYDFM